MKNSKIFFFFSLAIIAFAAQSFGQVEDMKKSSGKFGAPIKIKGAVSATEIPSKLESIDSLWVRVYGDVKAICQNKGCWMTIDIGHQETMRVKFKNYGFFVPMNCAGATATMEGWAYRRTTGIDELKHYASDAGKPQSEIDAITSPQTEFVYYADGVVLKKKK